MIENKHGELLLWTASRTEAIAKEKFVKLKKQNWAALEQEGYRLRKVQIKVVVE